MMLYFSKQRLKKWAISELKTAQQMIVSLVRYGIPIIGVCVLFFIFDIHAFNDFLLRGAAASGYTGTVKTLLYFGANLHADDDLALQAASHKGYTEIVKSLLDHGANIHARNDVALFLAIQNGHADIVKLLLAKGKFIVKCENLWIQAAAQSKNPEIIDLIRKNISPAGISNSNVCSSTQPSRM